MNAIINSPSFTVADTAIAIFDGLYSLGDLHKASGGENKHRPTFFLQNQETKELITEIQSENQTAVKVIKGNFSNGKKQGTYVCKELVYRYAMWISAKFSLMVIRAFDSLVTRPDSKQREALIAVCDKLAVRHSLRSEVYTMIANEFGYEKVTQIPTPLLPEAIAFAYQMLLRLNPIEVVTQSSLSENDKINLKALVCHTFNMARWYKKVSEPIRLLNRDLQVESAEAFWTAERVASGLNSQFGLGVDTQRLLAK